MAEDKSLTPEQQLLKLIEETNKTSKAAPVPQASVPKSVKIRKPSNFSLAKIPGQILGMFSFWKRNAHKTRSTHRKTAINIADVNKGLIVLAGFLFLYVVFDAAASARNVQRPPNFVPGKDMMVPFQKDPVEPLQESSYYFQKISTRDIFKEGAKEVAPKEEKVMEAPAATAEAIQNLALVGISWSKNPDAIVEDKSQQRTFFVKRGQMIGDNVKVEAIFKDHVIVSFEDREYELR